MSKIFGIHSRLTELPASPEAPASAQNNTPAIEILTPAEAASNAYLQEHNFMNLKYSQEIHFCKAEVHMDFLYGTFVIPPKGKTPMRPPSAMRFLKIASYSLMTETMSFVS